jgi:hypothetical protein
VPCGTARIGGTIDAFPLGTARPTAVARSADGSMYRSAYCSGASAPGGATRTARPRSRGKETGRCPGFVGDSLGTLLGLPADGPGARDPPCACATGGRRGT